MSRLFVDLGNTRIKWVWQTGERTSEMQSVSWEVVDADPERLLKAMSASLESASAEHIWLCSVVSVKRTDWLKEQLQQAWSIPLEQAATQSAQLGLVCGYRKASELGVDRWLAMLAARALNPSQPVCVISCGTAVTFDAISADGQHLGGVILPGLSTMRRALARDTGALPLVTEHVGTGFQASTQAGIASGTLGALIGAVQYHVSLASEQFEQPMRCWLCGGDAPLLIDHLPKGSVLKHDLVLKGLVHYARASGLQAFT